MSSVEQALSVVVPSVVNLESPLLSVRLSRNDEAEYLSNDYQYLVQDVADDLESDEVEDMFSTE